MTGRRLTERQHARSPALRIRSAVLCALVLTAVPSLHAQQAPQPLTLERALHLARENNPEFLRTGNDLDVARSGVRSAWGSMLPTLGSSLGFSGSRAVSVTGVDDFGEPVARPEALTSRSSSASQGISASMTLFDGGANFRNVQSRRAGYAGAEAGIAAQRIALDARVSREFFQAVRATRTIQLEERLLESARGRLTRTEELMALAAANQVDVLGAQADVAQSELNLERARGEAEKAGLSLAVTLGMDPLTPLALDTALPPVFDPSVLDAEQLVEMAQAGSPLLRQRTAQLTAARHSASAARGRRLPQVTANAGYSRSMSLPNYSAFGEFNPQNYGFSFGIGLQLPLFSRFQVSDAITQADAAVTDAGYDLEAARLALERDVRQAVIDLLNAHRSLQLAERQVELNQRRLEMTQEQYRLGSRSFLDLQNVINQSAQAERQALDARFGFFSARITLEERLGRSLEM